MDIHIEVALPDEQSERAPRSASMVASARACEVCGTALTGRPQQKCCSARCRAAKSRRRRLPLPVAAAREIKASLTMILDTAWQIKATLERYSE